MASGETLITLKANDAVAPASGGASPDNRNGQPVWDFDPTSAESIIFPNLNMPSNYAGTTGVTVAIKWSMSSAETGDVDLTAAFELIGEETLDTDTDNFAAANAVTAITVPAISGHAKTTNITFTDGADMASVVAGSLFRLKITRDAPNDSALGDLEVKTVTISET